MKTIICICCTLLSLYDYAQHTATTPSPLDGLSYGVVLDDPATKDVTVTSDITYLADEKGKLSLDVYSPKDLQKGEIRPAVVFLNAIGERAGERKVKSWGIYTSWPRLMAANGFIGISMETDGARIQESIKGLFKFIAAKGTQHNIDAERIGVYAASANVTQSTTYLMNKEAHPGIRAAVLYYGNAPQGPFRKDLPVLFVISEGDVRPNAYNNLWNEVLKNNAPWTIKMGTGMPHAFDAYSDNEAARRIVKETISFWKNNLDNVPIPTWKYSKGRDVLGSLQMDRPKAMKLIKELVAEYPDDQTLLFTYANVLRQAENYTASAEIYTRILAKDPKNVQAIINLASLSYAQNKPEEATRYISQAVNSGLMTRNHYAELGFTLLVANKNQESASYYEKALAMEPRAIDYYNLACAYAKYNEKDKALKALENSLRSGYGFRQQIEADTDFDLIRKDQGFKDLLDSIK